jgi:hypothetical protein
MRKLPWSSQFPRSDCRLADQRPRERLAVGVEHAAAHAQQIGIDRAAAGQRPLRFAGGTLLAGGAGLRARRNDGLVDLVLRITRQ